MITKATATTIVTISAVSAQHTQSVVDNIFMYHSPSQRRSQKFHLGGINFKD